jgi:hypothetical protein
MPARAGAELGLSAPAMGRKSLVTGGPRVAGRGPRDMGRLPWAMAESRGSAGGSGTRLLTAEVAGGDLIPRKPGQSGDTLIISKGKPPSEDSHVSNLPN